MSDRHVHKFRFEKVRRRGLAGAVGLKQFDWICDCGVTNAEALLQTLREIDDSQKRLDALERGLDNLGK